MKRLLREYYIELLAVVVCLVGVAMIVIHVDFREIIVNMVHLSTSVLQNIFLSIYQGVEKYITNFTLSDLFGLIIIILAFAFIYWRVRYRILQRLRWTEHRCPKCQETVHRIHRRKTDRILSFFLGRPIRRYQCINKECRWTGLRYSHKRSHQEDDFLASKPANGI